LWELEDCSTAIKEISKALADELAEVSANGLAEGFCGVGGGSSFGLDLALVGEAAAISGVLLGEGVVDALLAGECRICSSIWLCAGGFSGLSTATHSLKAADRRAGEINGAACNEGL
jgi:hypothetical protein